MKPILFHHKHRVSVKYICLLLLYFTASQVNGQCAAGGVLGGAIVPTTAWQTVPCVNANTYYTFAAVAGNKYVFSFCNGGGTAAFSLGSEITIQTAAGVPVGALGYSAAAAPGCVGPNIRTEVRWTATATATFRILATEWLCGNWTAPPCATLAYKMFTPPPAGMTCGSPFVIPSIPFTHTGRSTCAAGNDYNSTMGCASTYMNGEDFVYTYVSPGNECLSFTLNNTSSNHGLFVLNGCPSTGGVTCLGKIDAPGVTTLNGVNLVAAGTYYIVVSSLSPPFNCLLNYDLSITNCPTGATCSTPRVIPSLPYVQVGMSTCGFGNDYSSADTCKSSYMNGDDFVFRYTSAGNECIDIGVSGASANAGLFLLNACPNAPGATCMASSTPIVGSPSILGAYLSSPGNYYIIVSKAGAPSCMPFNIVVDTCSPIPPCGPSPPPQDSCSIAPSITGWAIFCGNTNPATYTIDIPGNLNSVFCGVIDNNSWFSFVADSVTKNFYFTVGPCDLGLGIQAMVFSAVGCSTFTGVSNCFNPGIMTNGTVTATGLTVGQTYYLMIDGQANDNCEYVVTTSGTLPVDFLFAEAYISGEDVNVIWETANEESHAGFYIEQGHIWTGGEKGGIQWETVGYEKWKPNATGKNRYQHTHRNSQWLNQPFYRVRQLDYDGFSTYSDVVEVRGDGELPVELINVYPNPSSSEVTFEFRTIDESGAVLEIYDLTGKKILEKSIEPDSPGRRSYILPVQNFENGLYVYRMLIGGISFSGRIQILH